MKIITITEDELSLMIQTRITRERRMCARQTSARMQALAEERDTLRRERDRLAQELEAVNRQRPPRKGANEP